MLTTGAAVQIGRGPPLGYTLNESWNQSLAARAVLKLLFLMATHSFRLLVKASVVRAPCQPPGWPPRRQQWDRWSEWELWLSSGCLLSVNRWALHSTMAKIREQTGCQASEESCFYMDPCWHMLSRMYAQWRVLSLQSHRLHHRWLTSFQTLNQGG